MIKFIKGIYGIVKRQMMYDHACSLMTVAGRPATQIADWAPIITRHRMLAVVATDTGFTIPAILDIWDRCKSLDILMLAAEIANDRKTDLLEGYLEVGRMHADNLMGRN